MPYKPQYDPSLEHYGQAKASGTNPPQPLVPFGYGWSGVYIGPPAMKSEGALATTIVHEASHYEDGYGFTYRAGLGRNQYRDWVDGGRQEQLGDAVVTNIFAWIEGELDAIRDQIDHETYQHLDLEEIDEINDYLNEIEEARSDMLSHGYSR